MREGSGRAAETQDRTAPSLLPYLLQSTGGWGGVQPPFPWNLGNRGQGFLHKLGSACGLQQAVLVGERISNKSGQEKCRERQEGMKPFAGSVRRGGVLSSLFWLCCFVFQGIWDNSWSGLFIPVGNTSLYGLQDAVGGSGTKRASNVKVTGSLPLFMLLLMTGLTQPWTQPCCMALILT